MNRQLPIRAVLVAMMMAVPGQAHAWTPPGGCAAAAAGLQTCAGFQAQIEAVGQWTQVFGLNTSSPVAAPDFQPAWGAISASNDDGSYQGTTTPVPEPLTMTLVGTGLIGVALVARRRRSGLEAERDQEE
jgi:hypothetical protein